MLELELVLVCRRAEIRNLDIVSAYRARDHPAVADSHSAGAAPECPLIREHGLGRWMLVFDQLAGPRVAPEKTYFSRGGGGGAWALFNCR